MKLEIQMSEYEYFAAFFVIIVLLSGVAVLRMII